MYQIHEPNQTRRQKILDILEKLGYKINQCMNSSYEYIIIYYENRVGGNNYYEQNFGKLITFEELLLRRDHPTIKIGCQTVEFLDDGSAIICNNETILFDKVKEIYEHMKLLRDN